MTTLEEIEGLPNGARFVRADLHIHSYGGSYDVIDSTMTPEAIVATARKEGLDLIAIADHNEIQNIPAALKAATRIGMLVVPAVELSTGGGHLLCYLESIEDLEKFYSRIQIADRHTKNSRCQTSLFECLNILDSLSGFGVLAHVDAESGFESQNPGNQPHKIDVLCHPALLGVELKNASSSIYYSDIDSDANRTAAGRERSKRLLLGAKQFLGRVLNSDSHSLAGLGRNAQGDRKVTRYKMDQPSYQGLRIALQDADARVRIEDLLPPSVPRIVGVAFSGGFLDGQQIHFSPNLNCIIGGRGTGKSTTFEALRCLTNESNDSQIVDSEVWPETLQLFWQDQAGQRHSLTRPILGSVMNEDDPIAGPTFFQIESYSQGETAKISKEANSNPISLLGYLDRFVDLQELFALEQKGRDELLGLQSEIGKAERQVEQIPSTKQALLRAQQQLQTLEKAQAKEVIALQRRLSTEREIRTQISEKLKRISDGLDSISPRDTIDEIKNLVDPKTLSVGAAEFQEIVSEANRFRTDADAAQSAMKENFKKLDEAAKTQIAAWKKKDSDAEKAIEEKKKILAAQKIPLDMAYITRLANDEARLKTTLANLETWKPHLTELRKRYAAALEKRWGTRERIAMTREAFAKSASEALKSALSGLTVTLKFSRNAYSPSAERRVGEALGWRTTRLQKASVLVRELTLPGLLSAIGKKDIKAITSLQVDGANPFDRGDAEHILNALSVPAIKSALEICEVQDLPRLSVTKDIAAAGETPKYVTRDFSKLSLGQQQSVLLAIMLSSKSNAPLIIDQPEDNLDGEFIYHSLVPVLRMAKERRQIIIVTHNANVAVLGDAEQIIALKSTNEKGSITSRGSIDEPTTRGTACSILEGAIEAFERRAKIYGVPLGLVARSSAKLG